MRRLVLPLLLALGACAAPNVAPVPFEEARALRRAGLPGTAAVFVLPPQGALPAPGATPVLVDGAERGAILPAQALLVPTTAAVALGTGREAVRIAAGESAQLAIRSGPDGPRVQRLDAAEGAAALASRALVRPSASPPPDPSAAAIRGLPDAAAAEAVAAGAMPAGRGRLLAGVGEWIDERRGLTSLLPPLDAARGDLVVEGVTVGMIDRGEVLALDLPPGTYAVHWVPRMGVWTVRPHPDSTVALPATLEIAAGQVTAIRLNALDRTVTRIGLAPGNVGTATFSGAVYAGLLPVPAAELLHGARVLVPRAEALAAMPGASLPGR